MKINLPRTALCQSIGDKMNGGNNKKDDDDDIPDRYSNCFPSQFLSSIYTIINQYTCMHMHSSLSL